jgi:lycopene beta-cyclase
MTYLDFHLLFLLPPLLLLLYRFPRAVSRLGTRARWTLPLVAAIAFTYTTPWDNYLVANGIWWYGPDRVIGTIGYVPVEEYLFFLLQPFLTGMFCYHLLARDLEVGAGRGRARELEAGAGRGRARELGEGAGKACARDLGNGNGNGRGNRSAPGSAHGGGDALQTRMAGGITGALFLVAGALLLGTEQGTYMGLILVWAVPVATGMWLFMGPEIRRRRSVVLPAILVPTLYLWVADRVAIGSGIWEISPEHTLGWNPLGLPVEEAVFFLVTNVLVVFGVILFLVPGLPANDPRVAEDAARRDDARAAP